MSRIDGQVDPALDRLGDPLSLKGMSQAVAAIAAAVSRGDTILVHGDYDVDGMSSTTLYVRALRALGLALTIALTTWALAAIGAA